MRLSIEITPINRTAPRQMMICHLVGSDFLIYMLYLNVPSHYLN